MNDANIAYEFGGRERVGGFVLGVGLHPAVDFAGDYFFIGGGGIEVEGDGFEWRCHLELTDIFNQINLSSKNSLYA